MSEPYVGEIRMVGFNFAPVGWQFCDGSLLPISEYETLFNLIGTTYGGDGQNTFAVPSISGRLPVHMGQGPGLPSNRTLGELGGLEQVTLTLTQLPAHTHPLLTSNSPGPQTNPTGNVTAQPNQIQPYIDDVPSVAMAPNMLGGSGGSQPHENMMPFLVINFVISLYGIYPTPT